MPMSLTDQFLSFLFCRFHLSSPLFIFSLPLLFSSLPFLFLIFSSHFSLFHFFPFLHFCQSFRSLHSIVFSSFVLLLFHSPLFSLLFSSPAQFLPFSPLPIVLSCSLLFSSFLHFSLHFSHSSSFVVYSVLLYFIPVSPVLFSSFPFSLLLLFSVPFPSLLFISRLFSAPFPISLLFCSFLFCFARLIIKVKTT